MWPFSKRKSKARADLLTEFRWGVLQDAANESERSANESERLRSSRTILICGELVDETANTAIAKLLFLQSEDAQKPITLVIHSTGGSVSAAMAIVDTMKWLKQPVHTRAPALAQGMALVVLANGNKGERCIGPAAKLALARLETSEPAAPEEFERITRTIASSLAAVTELDSEFLAHRVLKGESFTPADAIACGLADRIEE
jgi:ATP-dependent Clp protease protease subunit